jgi:hypothetical protein
MTQVQIRAAVQNLVPDAAISNARMDSFIQTAQEVFPMEYFVDHTDESSITLISETWEYALPETSSVSTFVAINAVWIESSTAGQFYELIPDHLYLLRYDGSGVWQLVLDHRVTPIDGRKIRIEGQKRYIKSSGDSDVVTLHNGWVIQYAAGLAHASQGGTESDMSTWHQRMASFHMAEATKLEDNMNNRARPGATLVPGVI